jgi:disulfide bond formation protein DsbB
MLPVSLSAAERFFSLLALIAGAGAIGIVVLRVVPSGRAMLVRLHDAALWMAWLVAATAMFGSLYFSEVQNFIPCRFCWFQRIAMYPLAIILLVAALRRDWTVRWYAVPLAAIGLVISSYHYLIEWFPELESSSCDPVLPCSSYYFREFGFVTLAFMALCGFAAILALLLLVPHSHPAPTPTSRPSEESTHES